MPLRVAANFLVVGDVGLLEIGARTHEEKLDGVIVTGTPVELRSRARAFSEIEKLFGLRGIEIASGSESIDKEIVAEPASLAAIVGIEVVIVDRGAAEIDVAMPAQLGAGTRGDVEDAAETIAVFRSETAGHEINGFEDLRADAGRKLRLSIVQKGDAVDEFVEGEFRATHSEKIVVAVAGAGHEVVDEVVGTFED